jgi:hypothetical protein
MCLRHAGGTRSSPKGLAARRSRGILYKNLPPTPFLPASLPFYSCLLPFLVPASYLIINVANR